MIGDAGENRWLISLINAAKKQPRVGGSRGIFDVLTMAVTKEQRRTASNNSQLSLYCVKEYVQKSCHPNVTAQFPV